MKMPNITPGPWGKKGPSKPTLGAHLGGDYAVIDGEKQIIAEAFFQSGFNRTHNAQANATAIAALPDLLGALLIVRRFGYRDEAKAIVDAALIKAGCSDA